MTTLILHGGTAGSADKPHDDFFREIITKTTASNVQICCIYFANDVQGWNESLKRDGELFGKSAEEMQKEVHVAMASPDPEVLRKQIQEADIVYIRGGRDIVTLQQHLAVVPDLKDIVAGKIIVGSSAGAYVLAKYYFSRRFGLKEGLGVFQIKVSAHCEESMRESIMESLYGSEEELPIYLLKEHEYVVLDQSYS